MINALFDREAEASDLAYINIRKGTATPEVAARELTERLWSIFRPYADKHFSKEIRRAFDERFWEMYLTCSLLELDLPVSCPKPGPDILISLEGQCIWVEAICPTQGAKENADRVPDYEAGACVATSVPNSEVILRLRHGIETKFRSYEEYINRGTISPDDAYVIAINGCQIPHARTRRDLPLIARCVFPIGDMTVFFSSDPSVPVEARYQYQRSVARRGGSEVVTDIFFQDRYQGLSAVLYSHVDAFNPTQRLGDDFVLIHNPRARVGVARGTIKRGKEIWAIETDDSFTLDTAVHE